MEKKSAQLRTKWHSNLIGRCLTVEIPGIIIFRFETLGEIQKRRRKKEKKKKSFLATGLAVPNRYTSQEDVSEVDDRDKGEYMEELHHQVLHQVPDVRCMIMYLIGRCQ